MPLYDYECKECKHAQEVMQSMADKKLDKCPKCEGLYVRLISNTHFQLKGLGWPSDEFTD